MEKMRNGYRIFVGKPDGTTWIPRQKWANSIKMDPNEGMKVVGWIQLAQNMV
jgi:hypothetical protein